MTNNSIAEISLSFHCNFLNRTDMAFSASLKHRNTNGEKAQRKVRLKLIMADSVSSK